jgi:hypothetical protein
MIRSVSILTAALTLSLSIQATQAQTEPDLSIFTPTPTVSAGQSFVIDVEISGVSDLYGWQLDLGFNHAVVNAGAASEGSFLTQGGSTFFIPGSNDNVGGTVANNANTLLTAIAGVSGNGVLETFAFTATHSGVSTFSLANVTLLDSQLNPINAVLSGASVQVSGSAAVPEPSVLSLLLMGILGCVAQSALARRSASRANGV